MRWYDQVSEGWDKKPPVPCFEYVGSTRIGNFLFVLIFKCLFRQFSFIKSLQSWQRLCNTGKRSSKAASLQNSFETSNLHQKLNRNLRLLTSLLIRFYFNPSKTTVTHMTRCWKTFYRPLSELPTTVSPGWRTPQLDLPSRIMSIA